MPRPTPEAKKLPFEVLDLRSITRSGPGTLIMVEIDFHVETWIKCGPIGMSQSERSHLWRVGARMDATDFEHDSAWAFCFEVVGLEFQYLDNGSAYFAGWIGGRDPDSFRVPTPGYDPNKAPDAGSCPSCKGDDKHLMVPFYMPSKTDEQAAQWERMRGSRIEIVTGVTFRK
jgi:hypothetical protein